MGVLVIFDHLLQEYRESDQLGKLENDLSEHPEGLC